VFNGSFAQNLRKCLFPGGKAPELLQRDPTELINYGGVREQEQQQQRREKRDMIERNITLGEKGQSVVMCAVRKRK